MTASTDRRVDRFSGRVAIVPGAAFGIGEATALRLGTDGASLALADVDAQRLDDVVAHMVTKDVPVVSRCIDVAVAEQVEGLVEFAVASFGRLDIMINNAGISLFGHVTELTPEQWHRVMAVDVDSVFYGSRAALPHLVAARGASSTPARYRDFSGTTGWRPTTPPRERWQT